MECTECGRESGEVCCMEVHPTEAGVVEFYLAFARNAGIACPVKDWAAANGQGEAWLRQIDSVTSPTQLRHFLPG